LSRARKRGGRKGREREREERRGEGDVTPIPGRLRDN